MKELANWSFFGLPLIVQTVKTVSDRFSTQAYGNTKTAMVMASQGPPKNICMAKL
jgi:hypothetical protein